MNKFPSLSLIFFGLFFLLTSFNTTDKTPLSNKKFVVVLDAGHGGHDPGNLGNGYLEKDIALSIVLKAGAILEKRDDIEVVYTRSDDTFVELDKRGLIANAAKADLFVSVHCDSHNSDAYGAGTFVLGLHANKQNFEVAKKENSVIYLEDNYEQKYGEYDINSPESIIGLTVMQEEFLEQSVQMAKLIQDNFTKNLSRKDRKVKQAGFIVLHQTFMPSVLVETGFLTNKNEGAYLNSKKGQEEMGKAIAEAVIKYKKAMISDEPELVDIETSIPSEVNEPTPTETKAVATAEQASKQAEAKESEIKTGSTEVLKTDNSSGVTFKVQILATPKDIALKSANFKGLNKLSREPYKNLYRYMYGSASTYQEAKKLKAEADAKGYKGCYVVAYREGTRITLKEGIKLSQQ